MEHKKIKLKPCPFCGGYARFKTFSLNSNSSSVGFKFEISCEKCRVSLPKIYETNLSLTDSGRINAINDERENAARDWNRRADDGISERE